MAYNVFIGPQEFHSVLFNYCTLDVKMFFRLCSLCNSVYVYSILFADFVWAKMRRGIRTSYSVESVKDS